MEQQPVQIEGKDYCITIEPTFRKDGGERGFVVFIQEGLCKPITIDEIFRDKNGGVVVFDDKDDAIEYIKIYLTQ